MASGVSAQTDFSSGELDPTVKRSGKNPIVKAGARSLANWRILNAGGVTNRSGRKVLYSQTGRTERFTIAPGIDYDISFGNTTLRIRDSTGAIVFSDSARPWNASQVKDIRWALYDKSLYIVYTGMVPRILTWDGAVTWSAADFAEQVLGTQKRTLFYRIAPKGITLTVSALIGVVNITFVGGNVLVAGMVGTRIRYQGRQMTIASVLTPLTGTATVNEALSSNSMHITFSAISGAFVVGDLVAEVFAGSFVPTGAGGIVTAVGAGNIDVTLSSAQAFAGGGGLYVIKTAASASGSETGATFNGPLPTVIWDQEVMNSYQGWPQSVAVDQNRLIFCDFPSVPGAVAWSTFLNFADFYPDAFAADGLSTDAIFELVPGKRRVYDVVPGMDASEFIFTDTGLFYVQITPANPLRPGSVGFNTISEDEIGRVQPRRAGEFILYVAGGLVDIYVVRIFGAYTRAYKTECITELSGHLFSAGINALAVMTASNTFAERYMFALNASGSVVCGKYSLSKSNELEGAVGFSPWNGNGSATWVAVKGAGILFTALYAPNGIAGVSLVEQLDDSRYLDASQLYNTQPSGLPIPGGKGPLWYIAGGSVDLMDGPLGTRMMGTYIIDANGFLVPQNNGGEDFTSVNLRVGQAWTATLEPFVPPAGEGQDVGQRMNDRTLEQVEVYVSNSTGFLMQSLYSGQYGPLLPAVGTAMAERRITTWNQGEDQTQPPPLREMAYHDNPLGSSPDPRWRIVKDTPGPLTIEDISLKVTA